MKTKITLIAVALLAICAYAANSWKATEDTPTAAGTTLVDDELLTASTVFETTLKASAISFAEQDFTHYIQVRVSALPSAEEIYGKQQDGSTSISLTAKKNIKLTIYYRRQSTEQTETEGVFAAEDGKDLKCFNQADASQISGELTIIQQTEDFKYGYATKVYELAEGNSYTLAARGTTIQFFGMTYETTEPAIPEMGEAIELNLESGKDIAAEVETAMESNPYPASITINLHGGGTYTCNNSIVVNCPLSINGTLPVESAPNTTTIDASALEGPMILISKDIHPDFMNESEAYNLGSFTFNYLNITGLKRQFFFANEMKVLLTELTVKNSIIGIDGTAKKTIFDFARGGNTAQLTVENSTIYAIPSNAQNGGFFSAQSSQDVPQLGGTTKTTSIKNSTLYGIATEKTTSTPRRNNNDYITYEVKNSIIVDCGKKAQFLKGLNGGQPGNNCVWDVDGNSFQWTEVIDEVPTLTDISADEICGADSALVKNNVEGVVLFANDVATGDFTLGDCPQNEAKIGDPRWLVEIVPAMGEDIELDCESGKDIAAEVATAMESNPYPASITVNLAPDGNYTCNNSIVVNCPLTIRLSPYIDPVPGHESYPTIDASALEEPMILVSKDIHPDFINESEAYNLGSFKFNNLNITGLKRQFFFANEMKVLLNELCVWYCTIGIDGTAKKTIFDFAKGGNTARLAIENSTIYAIPSNAQNGGFFSAQSSQDVPSLGGTTKNTVIKNSTLYGIATGKTTSTPRRNNNDYITYEVKNSIIVDCGKKAQFLKGLNGGQPGNNCVWDIDGNSFQWTEDIDGVPTLTDISADEICGADSALVKNNVEGVVVFANDVTTGDFTLGDCPQNEAKIGDPRWLVEIVPAMGEDIILNLESGKDIYAELAAAMVGNKYPGSITINLAADGVYTVSQTLEVNCPLTITGNAEQPATIDASALESPFVLLSKEIHPSFFNESDVYDMGSYIFENIKVTGLKRQFFFANEMKALVTELAVRNSVIGIDGTAKKTIFDFAKGGNTARLEVENSTIYAIPSNAQNGGFFSAQSSQDVPSLGGTTKNTVIKNSTLYGIATGKTTSTPRRNNNDYITYEVKNSIIVDCGKKAQFLKGLNGGQPGNNCVWDVDGNSFQWTEDIDGVPTLTDISADEICGADSALVKNNVEGVVVFANDVTTGDFTLGDCPQNEAKIGDPRWLVEIIPPLGDDIVLNIESGKDIAAEVATAMESNPYPKSITINLYLGEYTCNNSIVINCPLTINGSDPTSNPHYGQPNTTIDASALEEPMILISKDIHPGFLNESEAFTLGSFIFTGLNVKGLKRQFFYANEMKVLITELSVSDCVIGIDGTAKKTIFDFAKGGNTAMLSIMYSTIYAIPSNAQNGGFFSAQSSQDVPSLGGTTKTTSIKNSTLYGIATGKTTSTPRRNNNDYITYEVKSSIIVDCGKRGQFLKGLNGGQSGNNCVWDIDGNAFQWTETVDEVATITDISAEETCGGEVKNNVEGNVVFANDITTGDFTLGDCPQNAAPVGDPRWLNPNVGITDVHINNINDGLWYNIQGVQVAHPTKGIYIHNGKKVVIK